MAREGEMRGDRYGYGAYRRSGEDAEREVALARNLFLQRIEKVEPEVLLSLERDVLPAYAEIRHRLTLDGHRAVHVITKLLREAPNRLTNAKLATALATWMTRWNLNADWCRDVAVATIEPWCSNREEAKREFASELARWCPALSSEERRFQFADIGWEPTVRGRSSAAQRIRRSFENALGEYLDRVEELVKERGYWKALPREFTHVEWLARYQVRRESYQAIAKAPSATHLAARRGAPWRSVKTGVTALAKRIDLPLRHPDSGGRPRIRPGSPRPRHTRDRKRTRNV